MAGFFFIIDGYNLMHAWGLARRHYGPGDLQRSRERFLNQLAQRLTDAERMRTTVVFDAGREAPTDVPINQTHQNMRIVFALRDEDADTRIEKLVAEHSAPRQIRLVSSDRRLQTAARKRRGQFVTSEQFLSERTQAPSRAFPSPPSRELETKFTGELTEAEMAEWLEIFGESDEV
jgi:uncharacterized protein